MPLAPGQILLERYFIVRVVKSGGFGAVYEARDGRLDGAACAVKEMLEQHLGSEDFDLIQRKFLEEKALLARLKHPGIPAVRDFFREDQLCYIVMDYIHGANLDQELVDYQHLTGRPFPPEVMVSDVLQILDVLVYLHGLEPPVVHRDIKPANLIREYKTGKIMLVDFGLARHVSGPATQTAMGTLGYCPLEQMQGMSEPRSDIYALGVTMNHLLSGKPPIPLGTPSLLNNDPSQDPMLASVVDQACALKPEQRFATAHEMREALRRWQAPKKARPPAVPAVTVEDWPAFTPDPPPRRLSTAAMATGSVVALGLAFGLFITQPGPAPTPSPTPRVVSKPLEFRPTVKTPERTLASLPVRPGRPPTRPKPTPPVRHARPSPAPPAPVIVQPGRIDTPSYPTARHTPRQTPVDEVTPVPVTAPAPALALAPLSGAMVPREFHHYAIQLSIPKEFNESQMEPTETKLSAEYRQGEAAGLFRKIAVTARRKQPAAEFKLERLSRWGDLKITPRSLPISLPTAEFYRIDQESGSTVLGFFEGREPKGPPVQYEVMVSVNGPGAAQEVEPLASRVLGNVAWRRRPGGP